MNGIIFDIERFAVHDGPGIRTTVFLKGCPLHCVWCHNPEGISPLIHLWYFKNKCIRCHHCILACPNQALTTKEDSSIKIDSQHCNNTGACVAVCPTGALCFDGKAITSEEVIAAVLEDQVFYDHSFGGITLSGGEPLFQPEFSLDILKRAKEHQLHTAIETSLYTSKEQLLQFIPYVDLFMADIKFYDAEAHRHYTGVDNAQILRNIEFLVQEHAAVILRIPLIPSITSTMKNLSEIASFIKQLPKSVPVEFMNYNIFAESKYHLMNRENPYLKGMTSFNDDELTKFHDLFKAEGITVITR